jgi:hypothetical protein
LIPDSPAFGIQLPSADLRRAETAVLLEVLDLGHRNTLVVGLHLAALRAGVHHQRLAVDLGMNIAYMAEGLTKVYFGIQGGLELNDAEKP